MSTVTYKIALRDVLTKVLPVVGTIGLLTVGGVWTVMQVSLSGYELALTGQGATVSRIDERMSENFSANQARFNDMDARFTGLESRLLDELTALRNQNTAILAQLEGLKSDVRVLDEKVSPTSFESPALSPEIKRIKPQLPRYANPTIPLALAEPPAEAKPRLEPSGSIRRSAKGNDFIIGALIGGLLPGEHTNSKRANRSNRSASGASANKHLLLPAAYVSRLSSALPEGATVMVTTIDGKDRSRQYVIGTGSSQGSTQVADTSRTASPQKISAKPLDEVRFNPTQFNLSCDDVSAVEEHDRLHREVLALCSVKPDSVKYQFALMIPSNAGGQIPPVKSLRPLARPDLPLEE